MAVGNNLILVGPSGCGKSTLANHFATTYGMAHFNLDDYYVRHDPLYVFGKDGEPYRTYERPFMYSGDKLMYDVYKDCLAKMMPPGTWYTVIEGFIALQYKSVQQFPGIKVYLDVPFEVSVQRRKIRGRQDESDITYEMIGDQEIRKFVEPQKYMDGVHVLDATRPYNELLADISTLISL